MPATTSTRADQRRVELRGWRPGFLGPSARAPIVGSPIPVAQTCYRHPDRETGVSCSSCGRPICPECMTPTPVGMRCPECAQPAHPGAGASARRAGFAGAPATFVLIATQRGRLPRRDRRRQRRPRDRRQLARRRLRRCSGPSVAEGEWYRLVTGGFLHAGLDPHRLQHVRCSSSSAACSSRRSAPRASSPSISPRCSPAPSARCADRPRTAHGRRLRARSSASSARPS